MLTRIHVRNLAIVAELELELGAGMTALTGETGAGKSILVDALGLALGDRADTDMIRAGEERAEISAVFDVARVPGLGPWLLEQALESDGECVLRRVIAREGRSRAFVNGTPVPVQTLQRAGDLLLDIHGQHAHQSLLRREHQRRLLDEHGGHQSEVEAVAASYQTLRDAREELHALRGRTGDRSERLDLLRFQVEELEALVPQEAELATLDEEQRRLANADRLMEACGRLSARLYEDEDSVQSALGGAVQELDALMGLDPTLADPRELLESALIHVQEASSSLRAYLDAADRDPARLGEVERRLQEIHDLARKYRTTPDALAELLGRLRDERDELEGADARLEELQGRVDALQGRFDRAAEHLSVLRCRTAEALAEQVTEGMQRLGMEGGRFAARIERLGADQAGPRGIDRVEFLVTANPGQPLQPLAKVASGGELSRISLAIQVATARCADIPTLIFDEVDVGIGGAVAEIVGQLLRRLGEDRQVLCVTHLPQVAAQGHHHLQVTKQTRGRTTAASIRPLDAEARVREIARMLGGISITESTLAHAREMIGLCPGP
ncbi:MAG: DNA repair protein RecN [Chromatiales bacterium]|jgi:DNA repair protein RecN (Recombination protein N)